MAPDVRDFYDDLADEYEAIFEDWGASVRRQASALGGLLEGAGGPLLDVAAGMGTQAIGLALAGRDVVARDLSPRLVERGRREAARLGARLAFEVGDMREARPGDAGRFGAVIAFDNALPHLEGDLDLRAALRASRLALAPGGVFLASIRDYDALARARPSVDPPRLFGAAPNRRLVLQVWAWAEGGDSYELDLLVLREGPDGWSAPRRRARYRALLRAELEAAALAEGFATTRWLMPDESGFYQPVFEARRAR